MDYCGIIITGPKGVGKNTISKKLSEDYNFQIVRAVTTRTEREDDEIYDYVTKEEFNKMKGKNELFIYEDDYLGVAYGIKISSINDTINANKNPIIIITPNSLKMYNEIDINEKRFLFQSFFLNLKDSEIKKRIKKRESSLDDAILKQNEIDRGMKNEATYIINNKNITSTCNIINTIWNNKSNSGIIPHRIIKTLVEGETLLKNADINKIKGASYDLSLGDKYWQDGKKQILGDKKNWIKLTPGDYAIVSTKEIAELPNDITGRFDLTVGLFCQGIILSNGTQVDPGFKGRLFCLLFNTSNKNIEVKRGEHIATIEFIKLSEPTMPYKDKYQGKEDILDYFPKTSYPSTIVQLWKEVKKLKKARWWEKSLPTILIIITFVLMVILMIQLNFK